MQRLLELLVALVVLGGTRPAQATYLTLDPTGSAFSLVTGISGGNVVGYYSDASNHTHGFLYNGSGYTILDPTGSAITLATGVSGGNVVGIYLDSSNHYHGFLYTPDVAAVPEPSSLGLVGTATAAFAGYFG